MSTPLHFSFFESIEFLLLRDLDKLKTEIESYPDDGSIWLLDGQIKNSSGTLVLHLCGNLQHYVGVGLGKSDYKRDRDKEFSERKLPRTELIREIEKTKAAVKSAFAKVTPAVANEEYPLPVFDYPMTVQHFMIHLSSHLGYHLGQVNYHRRLVGDRDAKSI